MIVLALLGGALLAPAFALDGNDRLRLDLVGGARVEGWYVGVDGGVLRLSGDNRFVDVPVDQVEAVQRDDLPLGLEEFRAELAQAQALLDALRADPPPAPAPALVATGSFLHAGVGHAALGEWKGAAAWALLDAVVLSAAAWNLFGEESIPAAVPVLALDLVVKGAAAGDAARIARRNRRRVDGPLASSIGATQDGPGPP